MLQAESGIDATRGQLPAPHKFQPSVKPFDWQLFSFGLNICSAFPWLSHHLWRTRLQPLLGWSNQRPGSPLPCCAKIRVSTNTKTQSHHLKSCELFLPSSTSVCIWLAYSWWLAPSAMTLPFILVRVVEYATLWGPQEEIFGRWGHFVWSSISMLDSGFRPGL